ncbi:uncharacterized protein DFL_009028 [Arthrobotrys flagrans]|uniref:Peptidase S8/S53 domain-containing protein n=1 Tax=Arthrobotrys flagrans TaxID=97331 RepID=A0A436ZQN4_ARTFL|nr:hypothetical protein DFL_009028 [Arthrobotrys flagrans]
MWCIVSKSQRMNEVLFKELDEELLDGPLAGWPLPLAKFSTFKVKSGYLGVWAYAIISGTVRALVALESSLGALFRTKGMRYPFAVCEWYSCQLAPPGVEHWYNQEINGGSQGKLQSGSYAKRDIGRKHHRSPFSRNEIPNSKAQNRHQVRDLNKPSDTDDEVVAFKDAPAGLLILSAPKDPNFVATEQRKNTYFHYKNLGEGAVVYLLDTGFDPSHEEVEDIKIQD